MKSFIDDVLDDCLKKTESLDRLVFILPSKRAGLFLKYTLSNYIFKPHFTPPIHSIESFVEELSQLQSIDHLELLILFYKEYLNHTPKTEQQSFEEYLSWATTLLNDFNEIDRYLIDSDALFDYINAVENINHWSTETPTDLIKNHLQFWERFPKYFEGLKQALISESKGYQGMLYEQAVSNLETYISLHKNKHFVFLGFNALNKAEEVIMQELLAQGMASIYWDIDPYFLNDTIHQASYFINQHKNKWPNFNKTFIRGFEKHYSNTKSIEIIGVPMQIGQAKAAGSILSKLQVKNETLNKTALILADENLLLPVLSSIPNSISAINITMGLPLHQVPLSHFFSKLFNCQQHHTNKIYHKDFIALLQDPFTRILLNTSGVLTGSIQLAIEKNNIIQVDILKVTEEFKEKSSTLHLLFDSWNNDCSIAINSCLKLIEKLKEHILKKENNTILIEYLYRFNLLFKKLQTLQNSHGVLKNTSALTMIYKDLLANETIDFKGEPLEGLQIMGVLESRVLDFETVVITSVNEGILPSGKSNNSFIPYEIKREYGLPTYQEKDAVYTYHFYHLLQRAKRVFLIYNTEIDQLNGGERSRFISQLLNEKKHKIREIVLAPKGSTSSQDIICINKSENYITKLNSVAQRGFSPSSLSLYIRDPLKFYFRYILGIKDLNQVDEHIADNTFGTILHDTLEELYTPFIDCFLTTGELVKQMAHIKLVLQSKFNEHYGKGQYGTGKNRLSFEVAQRYIKNFILHEVDQLKQGHSIKILALEHPVSQSIYLPNLQREVLLKGVVDRIDSFDGVRRIIDYKSGKVTESSLKISNWEEVITDEKKDKAFQILCYAYMLKEDIVLTGAQAGIYGLKQINTGFMAFKDTTNSKGKAPTLIGDDVLTKFEAQLSDLLHSLYNKELSIEDNREG